MSWSHASLARLGSSFRRAAAITAVTIICAAATLMTAPVAADTVELTNGDRVTGRVVRLIEGRLVVEVAWGGELSIDAAAVAALTTEEPVELVLDDGTRLRGALGVAPAGELSITGEALSTPVAVSLARVAALNPPPRAVKLKGNLSGGVVIQSGNTETETLYAEGQLVARGEENRFTLGAQTTRTENGLRTTAENARASLKYDHFLSEHWYFAASSSLSHDPFQDLELRSAWGLSTGYQVLETPRTDLSLELGGSYVNEDLIDAPDRSFPAVRWSVDLERRLAADRVDLFHFHEGFHGLDGEEKLFVRSRTGLRLDLIADFIASAQLNYDYDQEPAPGRGSSDRAYLLTLGYEW